jgi:hypothetical protein
MVIRVESFRIFEFMIHATFTILQASVKWFPARTVGASSWRMMRIGPPQSGSCARSANHTVRTLKHTMPAR